MIDKIKAETWKKGKPASKFPKDWIVIPVLDANNILYKWADEARKELLKLIKDNKDICTNCQLRKIILNEVGK